MRSLILLLVLFLSACSSSDKEPDNLIDTTSQIKSEKGIFSYSYIESLESMCYAKIQKRIGETRLGRGVIWAECLNEYVMPVEQKNNPKKANEIREMYSFLIKDMKDFYSGQTTLDLLHRRWETRQKSIGYKAIRRFKDSYV